VNESREAGHTPGPWSPNPPGHGGKSWYVTRRNPRACMGTEYLMGPKQARMFRTRAAAQAASDKANAAISLATKDQP
jgi:hypothetical protein